MTTDGLTDVLFDQKQHLGIITLSRPNALNALTLPMIKAIQRQLDAWKSDQSIHAVLIKSDCEKAFCAGGDVRWLYEKGQHHDAELMQFFWHEYRLNYSIQHYPKPYIALMDGMTMGGGVGVSLHGSHPIASERFKFAMPETTIGFFPDIGASHLLSRCPGEIGAYLGLTGNRLNAEDARFCGLVKAIVPSEHFADLILALTNADLSDNAYEKVDACIASMSKTTPVTDAPIQAHLDTINTCFAPRSMNEIMSHLEHINIEWASALFVDLLAKSPLSLTVTLEQLRRAKSLSMADCLKMDYCLVGHFMKDNDFYEGVRALLIDKDKSPKWQPANLAQVSQAMAANYFECDNGELSLME